MYFYVSDVGFEMEDCLSISSSPGLSGRRITPLEVGGVNGDVVRSRQYFSAVAAFDDLTISPAQTT